MGGVNVQHDSKLEMVFFFLGNPNENQALIRGGK